MKWLADMANSLVKAVRDVLHPREQMQERKRQTRFTYRDGPMVFLGQQIVKAMQDAGYPAKIHTHYRSPEDQERAFASKNSKARAWQSPHQFLEAVDIVHPSLGWNVSQDYWDTLYSCAKIVEDRFGVTFELGYDWGWDLAHVELKDWRTVRDRLMDQQRRRKEPMRPPTPKELWERFKEVLPATARQHARAVGFREPQE